MTLSLQLQALLSSLGTYELNKGEFFFIVIMVCLPLAYIVHNVLGLMRLEKGEAKYSILDREFNRTCTSLAMRGNVVIFLAAYQAYIIRTLKYYIILDPFDIEIMSQKTYHWKIPIVVYAILIWISLAFFLPLVIIKSDFWRDAFELYIGLSCILAWIILPVVVSKFLQKLKKYFHTLYSNKHKIIKLFSISLTIWLLLRGIVQILLFAALQLERKQGHDEKYCKAVRIVFSVVHFLEYVPTCMIYIILWRNSYRRSGSRHLSSNKQSSTPSLNESYDYIDDTDSSNFELIHNVLPSVISFSRREKAFTVIERSYDSDNEKQYNYDSDNNHEAYTRQRVNTLDPSITLLF